MSYLITAIVFILMLSVLVLIHELGHFVMAKRAGIKVEEFGFGLPPRIWGKKKGETIYSINAIPFGGFVRMLGENELDPKAKKSTRSFAAKTMRQRTKVIIAGVVMNFFLAWLLMTIALLAGAKPFLLPDDVLPAISSGQIELQEGIIVNEVVENSLADQGGFEEGDRIFSFNGRLIDNQNLNKILDGSFDGEYGIERNGEFHEIEILQESDSLGLIFNGYVTLPLIDERTYTFIPRVRVLEVEEESVFAQAGVRSGDYILSVNGEKIFMMNDLERVLSDKGMESLMVYRDGQRLDLNADSNRGNQIIISQVVLDSPAENVGLREGDILLSVNSREVNELQDLSDFIKEEKDLEVEVLREGNELLFQLEARDNVIGVLLSNVRSFDHLVGLELYESDLLSSVSEVKKEKYFVHEAAYEGIKEVSRLSVLTFSAFGDFLSSLVSTGEMSEGVAGPVGIAQLTYGFVQEGFLPFLQFMAILSLSLAVINILPIPALDGGRLLFIMIELFLGRKVNQKLESYIHVFGYGLILLFILAVTYSDIARLISQA